MKAKKGRHTSHIHTKREKRRRGFGASYAVKFGIDLI
jgi:hypothetical protein